MQYEKLTRKSGLVPNADKTEILVLTNNIQREYDITYCGEETKIKTLKEIKICGIWYCNDADWAYKKALMLVWPLGCCWLSVMTTKWLSRRGDPL